MVVDRKWVVKNLGFDPIAQPAPRSTFAFADAAKTSHPDDLQRDIIDFDSEGPEGKEFLAFTTATGLSRFTDIPWPKGLQPVTDKTARKTASGALPKADILVVTWTVDEGHALSRVITPGKDSRNDYVSYTHNFDQISKLMRRGCPALEAKRLGTYWTGKIGKKTMVVFKSDSHMSQDGPDLPNIEVWAQLIGEVQPQLVITTGTAGGIGAQFEVGDVVVSPIVSFDCISKFKAQKFRKSNFSSVKPNGKMFAPAKQLFKANSGQLPKTNTRAPQIFPTALGDVPGCVVTTDFFGFDTSDNHYKLKNLGHVSEMGDAILGLVAEHLQNPSASDLDIAKFPILQAVAKQMAGKNLPRYVAVRNVSDPQIKAEGTIKQQANVAAQIYKAYGRWSSVCSAIVSWALIAAEK